MPWCPNCKTEYRDGFTTCADCGAQLVDNLADEPEMPDINGPILPVLLMHCPSTFDADATCALLRSFGIACFSQPDSGGEKIYTGVSLTGERIFVEHAQLAQAREIVRGFRRGRGQIDRADEAALLAAQPDSESGSAKSDADEPRTKSIFRTVLLLLILMQALFFFYTTFLA